MYVGEMRSARRIRATEKDVQRRKRLYKLFSYSLTRYAASDEFAAYLIFVTSARQATENCLPRFHL